MDRWGSNSVQNFCETSTLVRKGREENLKKGWRINFKKNNDKRMSIFIVVSQLTLFMVFNISLNILNIVFEKKPKLYIKCHFFSTEIKDPICCTAYLKLKYNVEIQLFMQIGRHLEHII